MRDDATREGVLTHAVLESFEAAALRLRRAGLSERQSDRIGLFLALTLPPLRTPIKEAWEYVETYFPRDTPPAGAGTPACNPNSNPRDTWSNP
jgi:hypothetical protein